MITGKPDSKTLLLKLAEDFILLDWGNKKQLDNIRKVLIKLEKMSKDNKMISALKKKWEGIRKTRKAPDEKEKKEMSDLLEQLLSPGKKEGTPEPAAVRSFEIKDADIELYELFLMESKENLDRIEKDLLELEKDRSNKENLRSIFRCFHNIKGVAKSYQFDHVGDLAHRLEDLLDLARNDRAEITEQFSTIILTGVDLLREMLIEGEEGLKQKRIVIREKDLSGILKTLEGYIKEHSISTPIPEVKKEVLVQNLMDQAKPQPAASQEPVPAQVVSAGPGITPSFLRVETRKMDQLVEMIGELSIISNMITGYKPLLSMKDGHMEQSLTQFKRITHTIEDAALKLRMVPIRDTFAKMERIVRDFRKNTAKKIGLRMSGEETEIDRNMTDELNEPLVHLIRNACDHGIEPSDQRIKKGKPEQGEISLKAFYKGRNVVIEMSDDGQGLDSQKLYEKAVEKGIISREDKIQEEEIYKLIFHPGFSTAEIITEISGRGVGMDVVQKMINRFRGKIEIETEKEKGTTFRLILPLTLAIIEGIIVRVGKEKFIIPAGSIKKSFQPRPEEYTKVAGKGEMIVLEDQLLTLMRLSDLFGVPSPVVDPGTGIVMIVEGRIRDYTLLVDEIMGKQEVVIKNLGAYLRQAKGIAGGAILSDGRIGLILDVFDIESFNYA